MPNTRRRKFSVQNEIRTKDTATTQIAFKSRKSELDVNRSSIKVPEISNKIHPSSAKPSNTIHITSGNSQSYSRDIQNKTCDKYVNATSSDINIFNSYTNSISEFETKTEESDVKSEILKQHQFTQHERARPRIEKHSHRIKVRSPKRKIPSSSRIYNNKKSIGLSCSIEADNEFIYDEKSDITKPNIIAEGTGLQLQVVPIEDMCRICHGGDTYSTEYGQMISACSCRGTIGRVHIHCLERWLTESGKSRCELCATRYSTRRVHRYGILKAVIMWLLSQNAKQLMVDGLGIMLMSPLAILAAWLSGKTLSGLMTQEPEIAPWPLASTFVLACMTLVCYYCWIVSAATRHALSWWIWYRSQYEVKLQIEDVEE